MWTVNDERDPLYRLLTWRWPTRRPSMLRAYLWSLPMSAALILALLGPLPVRVIGLVLFGGVLTLYLRAQRRRWGPRRTSRRHTR
jgi:hypothetical protein